MASAHIEISASATRLSGQTRYAIDRLQQTVDDYERLKAIMDQLALGGDWTSLGAALNVSATDAEALYNLWGSAVAELNATFIGQLLGRCG